MPGWSRVQTDWTETALVRHDSQVVRLGAGMLLDIDGDTAFLMTPPGETVVRQEPNRLVTGPGGASYVEQGKVITRKTPLTFRAVRWRDGAELARLEVKDACLQAPGLDLDGRPSSGRNAQVAYADVRGARARCPMCPDAMRACCWRRTRNCRARRAAQPAEAAPPQRR